MEQRPCSVYQLETLPLGLVCLRTNPSLTHSFDWHCLFIAILRTYYAVGIPPLLFISWVTLNKLAFPRPYVDRKSVNNM